MEVRRRKQEEYGARESEFFRGGLQRGETCGVFRQVVGSSGADGFIQYDFPAEELRDAVELVGDELVLGIAEGIGPAGHDADFLLCPQRGRFPVGSVVAGVELVDDILQLGGDAPPVNGRPEDHKVGGGHLLNDFDGVVDLDAVAAVALAGIAVAAGAERKVIDVQGLDRVARAEAVFDRAQGMGGVAVPAGASVQDKDVHLGFSWVMIDAVKERWLEFRLSDTPGPS